MYRVVTPSLDAPQQQCRRRVWLLRRQHLTPVAEASSLHALKRPAAAGLDARLDGPWLRGGMTIVEPLERSGSRYSPLPCSGPGQATVLARRGGSSSSPVSSAHEPAGAALALTIDLLILRIRPPPTAHATCGVVQHADHPQAQGCPRCPTSMTFSAPSVPVCESSG